jgi:hypothetical protein
VKPVCHPCQRFFRMKKSGYYFTEGMPIGERVPAGRVAADKWKPYKIWSGDLWECPECHATIISGFGFEPLGIQHQPEFAALRKQVGADQFQVNDC